MRSAVAVALLMVPIACTQHHKLTVEETTIDARLKMISDPHSSCDDIRRAIRALSGPAPRALWYSVIETPFNLACQRRLALIALCKQYISPPLPLSRFAEILHDFPWLSCGDLHEVIIVTGKTPVDVNLDDATFYFRIFPEPFDNVCAFYLHVSGKMSKEALCQQLHGQRTDDRMVLEIGFVDSPL